jgi:hypothetical protein
VLRATALRYLPRVPFERVAVLADEVDVAVLDGQDADGGVLVMDDSVDAGVAVGPDYLVLADGDPVVLVHGPRTEHAPGIGRLFWVHDAPGRAGLVSCWSIVLRTIRRHGLLS